MSERELSAEDKKRLMVLDAFCDLTAETGFLIVPKDRFSLEVKTKPEIGDSDYDRLGRLFRALTRAAEEIDVSSIVIGEKRMNEDEIIAQCPTFIARALEIFNESAAASQEPLPVAASAPQEAVSGIPQPTASAVAEPRGVRGVDRGLIGPPRPPVIVPVGPNRNAAAFVCN